MCARRGEQVIRISGLVFLVSLITGVLHAAETKPAEPTEAQQLDAIIAFDELQRGLIEWDLHLVRDYGSRGETELAQEKAESAGKRVDEVLSRYTAFLSRFPKSAAGHNYYGEALADLKRDDPKAVEEWLKAIQLDPKLADPHNNLGIYYGHVGQPEKAIDEFRKAIELNATVAEFHFDLALAYHNFRYVAMNKYKWTLQQVFSEALKESKTARSLKPNDLEIAMDYARTFFAAEDFKVTADWNEALAAWQHCLPLAKDSTEKFHVLVNLGRVALKMNKKEEARKYLNEALPFQPDSRTVKRLLELAQ